MEDGSNDEDLALMARVARGDKKAFGELVAKHQHSVIGTIGKMTNHSADTEDIAQQVFLRLWKAAPRYKPKAKFTTFLFTITRNLVFNETRRKSRRKEHSLEEQEEDWHAAASDQTPSSRPDQSLAQSELRQLVDQAIADLPEKQRLAVALRRYEQMPYEEIARVLDLSVSAVKSQLFRARTALRESLQPYLEE
ncbi:MAG: sigma-70 family RNA polymerase sigma factor [Akkermansiaceae bacterium]